MREAREERDVSSIDRMIRVQLGRFPLALSPATLILASLEAGPRPGSSNARVQPRAGVTVG